MIKNFFIQNVCRTFVGTKRKKMTHQELSKKKITMATLKAFVRKADKLFIEYVSRFDGMTDGLEYNKQRVLIPIEKDKVFERGGVYTVGNSRDYFTYQETDTHFGIEVYNSCGCSILWTEKVTEDKKEKKEKMIANVKLTSKTDESNFIQTKIHSSKDAYDVIRQFYFDDIDIYESFFILLVNRGNKTIAYAKIGQGGIAGVFVYVKIIAKYAVDCLASGVILAHNHPSGNLVPSQDDKNLTEKAKKALALLDVQVLDHLIITKDEYYSFSDNNIL